ncbi:MAG: histidine phosphatase family protein [Muribaculaceae bacterium]|nr:histidine phosphatase family protein [Muribaculaceae bacterium]
MKKIILTAALLASTLPIWSAARYSELPAPLDGSMSLYDFNATEPSALPDSLTAVHIDYVARHGARYLTSESKLKSCEKALQTARERGSLTQKGKDFMKLLESVRSNTAGQWGLLSDIGKEQEWRLGREMARMFPTVFSRDEAARKNGSATGYDAGTSVESVASYVPRVVQTMDIFTVAIADEYTGIDTQSASGHAYDRLTRFFVTDKAYDAWRKSGAWKSVYDDFVARHISTAPALRLVGNHSGLRDNELRKLTYDIYKVLQGMRAASLPAPTDEWMSEAEYRACWEATNLEKYFQYSISPLSELPAEGAKSLLYRLLGNSVDFSDDALGRGLTGVFGHAETLLPFFSLLGVGNPAAPVSDYDALASQWSDAELTPLGANIAVVYAVSASGRKYASMRLNGRNVPPIAGRSDLVVPLADLQDYWLKRLGI